MSATIQIQDDLFCEMIFAILEQTSTKQQVDWLKKYGTNFYKLQFYKFIEEKHSISQLTFDDITSKFWDDVLYKEITWVDLQTIIGADFLSKLLRIIIIKYFIKMLIFNNIICI